MDLWLMSCRVLKRGMEFAMMDEFVAECKERGIAKIKGFYYPTAKNKMVKDFYGMQGFDKIREFNEIFQDVFDDEDINVTDSTTAADVDGWDSLEHINLLVAIERGFGIRFTMGETTGLKNVGEMVDKIMAHLG